MSSGPATRVAVTRDEDPDGPLALALRSAGLQPVLCPAVSIAPPLNPGVLVRAARALESYDWLIVASVRAVAAIAEARGGRALPEALRTAAVGESTAAALRDAGAQSVLVGRGSGIRGLIPVLMDADQWPGRRILEPRAAQGRHELAEALSGWGARVEEVVAYHTLPRPVDEIAGCWRSARPEAVVITSPSAALALAGALGLPALRALDAVVAIGPTTAATLAQLGIAAVMSESADFASVARRTKNALIEAAARRLKTAPAGVGAEKEI